MHNVIHLIKVGCRHSIIQEVWMNSNSNGIEIARFRKLDCCCDTLLVDCTPRMTELAAGRVYTATLCTRLFNYTERVTE